MKILIVLVVLLLFAVIWDLRQNKIPNILILAGCCHGMIRLLCCSNVLEFIPGIIIPIIMLFPLYKIGVLGAGDLKLFSLLGFYFPFIKLIFCMLTAFIIGAIISVASFMRHDNFYERMTYLFSYLKECFHAGRFRYYYVDREGKKISESIESKSKIHFAIPIFFSVLFHIGGVM